MRLDLTRYSQDVKTGRTYIDIDFDSLSEENKKIAEYLGGELFVMHGIKPSRCIKTTFPVTIKTTVGNIRKMAKEAVSQFKLQEMTWARRDTLEDLRAVLMDGTLTVEDFPYLYYDKKSGYKQSVE
ncbi:MAG: hypothetical protein Q8O46_02585 [bacterium]|nr:hypothetical protein [bacterium]